MMVEDDQTKRPVVSVEGIENGNMVIVTGELKSGTWTAPSNTFWANNMNKTLPHVDFLEYIILWTIYY